MAFDDRGDDAGAATRRLFLRSAPTRPADAPPRALPRDAEGMTKRTGTDRDEYPLPTPEGLRETYEPAFARMERAAPLRVAALRDQLARTLGALDRFRAVRAEEMERQQFYNEDARHAEQVIDAKVAELRRAREEADRAHEKTIGAALEERARAREVAVVAQAAASGGTGALWKTFQAEDAAADDGGGTGDPGETAAEAAAPSPTPAEPAPENGAPPPAPAPRERGLTAMAAWLMRRRETPAPPEAAPPTPPNPVPPPPALAARETFRAADAPGPLHTPFPLDEARERTRPHAAIAVEQGFVHGSAADEKLGGTWERYLEWPALAVCGGIFGVSVGVLTELLDPALVTRRFGAVWPTVLFLAVLGGFVFWLLGRVVTALASLASEEFHGALTATRRDAPDRVGGWLQWAGIVSLFLMFVAGVALVAFEANVEKHGVMGALIARQANDAIARGGGATASGGVPEYAVWCIVLIVSAPFVLLHAAHGWIAARAKTLAAYIDARREAETWRIAEALHRTRDEEAQALHREELDLWRDRRDRHAFADDPGAHEAPPTPPTHADAFADPLGESVGSPNGFDEADDSIVRDIDDLWRDRLSRAIESVSGTVPDESALGADGGHRTLPPSPSGESAAAGGMATARSSAGSESALHFDADGRVLLRPGSVDALRAGEAVALAVTRAREAHFRVRMAYARRRDALGRIDADIARWEKQRATERQELDTEGVRRIEDAHAAYSHAARAFDRAYREEVERFERLTRPGWLYRVWQLLFRPHTD